MFRNSTNTTGFLNQPSLWSTDAHDLLELLLANTDLFVVCIDRDFQVQLYSKAVVDWLQQIQATPIEKGANILSYLSPQNKEKIEQVLHSVLEGNTHEIEQVAETAQGTVYLQHACRPIYNKDGNNIGVLVTSKNITEKRLAELAVLEAKNNLELLLNNTDESFILLNKDFSVILFNQVANQSLKRLTNLELKPGLNFMALNVPESDETPTRKERLQAVLEGQSSEYVFKVIVPNGAGIRFFHSYYKPAYNEQGEVSAVIVITRDVTETKLEELRQFELEERWRFALEGSNQGVWDWNIPTGEVYYSASYKKMYGFTDHELSNNINEWLQRVHPDDKAKMDASVQQHFTSTDPYFESIYRLQNKNGAFRWIMARGMVLSKDAAGNPVRMIGTHTDITLNKEIEESFKLMFYSHPLPMWTYDIETLRFVDVNDAALQHYGYTRTAFLSMSVYDIRPKEEANKLKAAIEKQKENQELLLETWHCKKDGELIYVQEKGKIIDHGTEKVTLISIVDLTQKIRSEEALLESERQYRILFKNNPLPSWIYDLETLKFLEVNDAAIQSYGYSKEEFSQLLLTDLQPPDRQKEFEKGLAEIKSGQDLFHDQWKHRRKNGEVAEVIVTSNTIVYNKKTARLAVVHDITDKAKAEKELQESNERFELVGKATSDAIYDWNLLTNTLTWGNGLQKLFGYKNNEVTVIEWEELIHEEDRQSVSNSISHAIAHPKKLYWKTEYRFRKKDGAYSYVLDRGFIVRDEANQPIRMIGAMQDITDIKQKEQELIKSHERLDIVIKATNDLIWDWNLETGTFYRDKEGMEKVYGVKDPKSIQNIYFWLQRIHPEDQELLQKTIDDILHARDEQTFEVEYRFRRDDGTYSYVYDRGKIICNDEGKPSRMIGAAQDITERKRLEQQLLQKEIEKQNLISEATIETQEMERSEIGKELHDNVNQVLTTTKLYLELAANNAEMKDELIQKSAKNVMYVINEIRQLSRSLMNPSIGDLGLIDSIKDLIENINVTRKLHVIMDHSDDVEESISENYKLMVFRVIQEALNNAVKHAKAETVLLTLRRDKEALLLTIIDNGVGFDTDTVKKGTGLNNIQNRVYLANGALTIISAPGKGTKLLINFPILNGSK